eukprot:1156329-Pelagomonas_calceolata.AAC.10
MASCSRKALESCKAVQHVPNNAIERERGTAALRLRANLLLILSSTTWNCIQTHHEGIRANTMDDRSMLAKKRNPTTCIFPARVLLVAQAFSSTSACEVQVGANMPI